VHLDHRLLSAIWLRGARDKVFTLSMWNTTMGATAAEYAYKTKNWTKAWVVTDTFIDYTTSLSRYFIAQFETLGGTVLFEDTYTQGAQDFSAQLARIQASTEEPDFIYVSSYMPDLGTIIRTIREAGIDLPIVGGDTYDDPGLFEAVGPDYGNEVYFVTHGFLSPIPIRASATSSRATRQNTARIPKPSGSCPATMWSTC